MRHKEEFKKHKVHSKGDFLNLPFQHSDGTIFTSVIYDEGRYNTPDITCQFRDCSHSIHLSMNVDTEDDLENSLHKVDVIVNNLKEFREALIKVRKLYVDHEEKAKKEEEEKKNGEQSTISQATADIPE